MRFLDPLTGHGAGADRVLPEPVQVLAAAPDGRLAMAFGSHVAVLVPR